MLEDLEYNGRCGNGIKIITKRNKSDMIIDNQLLLGAIYGLNKVVEQYTVGAQGKEIVSSPDWSSARLCISGMLDNRIAKDMIQKRFFSVTRDEYLIIEDQGGLHISGEFIVTKFHMQVKEKSLFKVDLVLESTGKVTCLS